MKFSQLRRAVVCSAVALTVITIPASAQLTIQGGVGVGVAVPAADYGGSTVDYYAGTKYGLSTGYNAHGKIRLGALGTRVTGEVSYTSLSNSGNSEPGQGKVEVNQSIVSFRVGPEYAFSLPFAPITPYLGARAGVNIINGETTFQGVARVPSGTYKLQSGVRIGVGGTLGIIVSVGPLMNLDFAAHYDALNLLGRLWEDTNPLDEDRVDSYLAINDEPDPLYSPGSTQHIVNKSRDIHTMHFTVTLMFGL